MDGDLRDLLSAWLGGEAEPDARSLDELLARLRDDEGFRQAFVREIRMLGMIRAVQSGEPRWLRIEDELGWGSGDRMTDRAFEDGVLDRLGAPPRPRRRAPFALAAVALLATGLALAFSWYISQRPEIPPIARPAPKVDVADGLAIVIGLDRARWEAADGRQPAEGEVLAPGRLRLNSGRATIAMLNGVVIIIEGPADVELISTDQISCNSGKLRARVPPGAEGFLVSGPGSAIVDLGTEFGVNIGPDGISQGKVFEGEVEAAVLGSTGAVRRSQLIRQGDDANREGGTFEIDPGTGRIGSLTGHEDFVPAPKLATPPLALDPSYPAAVAASRPRGYWRFESLAAGAIPNEIPGQPPMLGRGPVAIAGPSGGNRWAAFEGEAIDGYFELQDPWQPKRDPGFAIEFWFSPEMIGHAALVGLLAPKDTSHHLALVELTSRNRLTLFRPATARFLYRWPAGRSGGDNTFSDDAYIPYRWHHLVAQVDRDRMELYLNGKLQSTQSLDPNGSTSPCQVLLGRLTTIVHSESLPPTGYRRPFVGLMDEVALYDRPLSIEEIRAHFRLATRGKPTD